VKRSLALLLIATLLLATAHRLPAPIQEVPESPSPAPEQPTKPKPKRTVKPKTRESSEASTKPKTSSPPPKSQATPERNSIDGTWTGTLNCPVGFGVGNGEVQFTLAISGTGTVVNVKSIPWGLEHGHRVSYDGKTLRWQTGSNWTLTPNADGKTALLTASASGLFGINAFNSSATFHRMSQ
jgi:hypothetical protein